MASIWDNIKNLMNSTPLQSTYVNTDKPKTSQVLNTLKPTTNTVKPTTNTVKPQQEQPISYKNEYNSDGSYTSPKGNTYSARYMEEQKKQAQQYAQNALNGTSGVYVPASQTANAMINAQVPINNVGDNQDNAEAEEKAKTDALYNAYVQAQAQQNQAALDRITQQYNNAMDSTNKYKETAMSNLTAQKDALMELLAGQLDTAKGDAVKAKEDAVKLLESQLGISKEQAQKQLDDAIARAGEQKALMEQQRLMQLNNSRDVNARAAENSMRDAYTAYMLGMKNMPQQLKALGISGGGSESSLANINNAYMNNRNLANLQMNDANRQAQHLYDTGINEDAMNYNNVVNNSNNIYYDRIANAQNIYNSGMLDANSIYNNAIANANAAYNSGVLNANNQYFSNKYDLDNSIAQALIDMQLARDNALANAKLSQQTDYAALMKQATSGKTDTSKSTTSGSGNVEGLRIGNNQTVHTDSASQTAGASLLQELYDMGFTEAQAREYLKNAGVM